MKESYHPVNIEENVETTPNKSKVSTVTVGRGKPVPATSNSPGTVGIPRARCLLASFCGCYSLATGVFIIAIFDLLASVAYLIGAAMIYYAKANEVAIDEYITAEWDQEHEGDLDESKDNLMTLSTNPQPGLGDQTPTQAADETMSAEEVAQETNSIIDISAKFAPVYIIFAAFTMYFALKGIKAARQADANAAAIYYKWKITVLVFTTFVAMFGGFGALHFALTVYFTLVVRSYLRSLVVSEGNETLPQV